MSFPTSQLLPGAWPIHNRHCHLQRGPLRSRAERPPVAAFSSWWCSSLRAAASPSRGPYKPTPTLAALTRYHGLCRGLIYGSVPTQRASVHCAAYGGGPSGRRRGSGGGGGSEPNYYELLGLEPDCDEEDIRVAFRRLAKELHPDVNKGEGATEAFVQLSRAYEVLSDAEARREYDITHRTRRLNFFQDIEDEEDEDVRAARSSPFRWSSRVGRWPGSEGEDPGAQHDYQHGEGEEGEEEAPGVSEQQQMRNQEQLLEELAKFMSGSGSLRAWQSGRLDPWGNSTSDAWFQRVEKQTRNPYGPSRPGFGSSRGDDDNGFGADGNEWDPSRRVPGWTPPGRGTEWNHPRRQWDEEDQRGFAPDRRGRGGGGGGGDFRRPFKT